MRGREELVERLAIRRRAKLGDLSDNAYAELVRTVRADPAQFIEDPADEAFSLVVAAAERYRRQSERDEYFDEGEYMAARARRLNRLGVDSAQALSIDPTCVDAALCSILARDLNPEQLFAALIHLDDEITEREGPIEAVIQDLPAFPRPAFEEGSANSASAPDGPTQTSEEEPDPLFDVPVAPALSNEPQVSTVSPSDAWGDVFCHGRLRVRAAIAQSCLDTTRYRMAQKTCEDLLALAPSDYLGARHGALLALARLEDEEGFDALDAKLDRRGDAWSHLGRVILLYKLGRTAAARRALQGFSRLVEGGAYALLRPVLMDTYVPDRPEAPACSFAEATMAVFEADPIIMDIPDFAPWAESVDGIALAARSYADLNGFDW